MEEREQKDAQSRRKKLPCDFFDDSKMRIHNQITTLSNTVNIVHKGQSEIIFSR